MITIGVRTSHGQDWRQRIRPPYARSWTSSSPPKWQSTRAVAIWRGKFHYLPHTPSGIKFSTIFVCAKKKEKRIADCPMKCHVQFQCPIQFKFAMQHSPVAVAFRSFPLFHLSTWAHCSCDICCHKGLSVVTAFCRFVSLFPHFSSPPDYSTRSFDISISISSL